MKKHLLSLLFIVFSFLMVSPVLAKQSGESNKQKRPKRNIELNKMDANGDKDISKEECEAYFEKKAKRRANKLFSKFDLNSDGVLTQEEIKKAINRRVEEGEGGGEEEE